MCMTFLFLKYKNSSDFFNGVRTCTRPDFFASEFMNIWDDFQFSVTQINSTFYSVFKLKYRNLNSWFHLLISFSGDTSLNLEPTHQHKLQGFNEWNIFKLRGLHFILLNINSLLPKIEELRIIAKSTNRSRHQRCSVRKVVLRNLTKFTGKHLCLKLQVSGVFLWILLNF